MRRTTYAGLVDEKYLDQEVCLKGWVQKRRNLGNLIFIDLRDIEGIVQLVFSQEFNPEALKVAEQLRSEYVIEVKGKVVARGEKAINPNMRTGKVEVEVSDIDAMIDEAENFPAKIALFVIAVTTKRDARLQSYVYNLSDSRIREKKFPVEIIFWEDIEHIVKTNDFLLRTYYPELYINLENSKMKVQKNFMKSAA